MKHSLLTMLCVLSLSSLVQGQGKLYFTCERNLPAEHALGGCGGRLDRFGPKCVEMVEPGAGVYSAGKFLSVTGLNALLGDYDGDGVYYTSTFGTAIDAVTILGAPGRPSVRDLFFSVATPVTGVTGGGWTIGPADIVRIASTGIPEVMLDEAQIRSALSLSPNDVVNVDAIEVSSLDGTIYLSFEDDVHLFGADLLQNGGVAAIPGSAVVWAGRLVSSVAPGSGVIMMSEATVDFQVSSASISDHSAAQVTAIGDLDGLAEDPQGGRLFVQYRGKTWTFDNLMYCGEGLTGAGVCTTQAGGQIAVFNGVNLGTPFGMGPTDGTQVGVSPGPPLVGSLNGLEGSGPAARFVMDSRDTLIAPGDDVVLQVGGVPTGNPIALHVGFGPVAPGGVPFFAPAPNPAFPEWVVTGAGGFSPFGVAGAWGCCVVNYGPYAGGIPVGTTLVVQAIAAGPGGGLGLSVPLTLQFQ